MEPSGNARFNAEAAAWDSNPLVHELTKQAWLALQSRVPMLQVSSPPSSRSDSPPNSQSKSIDVLEIGCGTGVLSLAVARHPLVRHIVAVDAAQGMIDVLEHKLRLRSSQPDSDSSSASSATATAATNGKSKSNSDDDDEHDDRNENKSETPNSDDTWKKITPTCVMLIDPEDDALPLASSPSSPDKSSSTSSSSSSSSSTSTAAAGGESRQKLKFDLITSHLVLHHIPSLEAVLATMFGCLKSGGMIALTDFEDFGPEARKFHPEAKMAGVERHGINRVWITGLIEDAGFVDVDVQVAWRTVKRVETFPGEFGAGGGPAKTTASAGGNEQGEDMEFSFLLCMARKP